MESDKIVINGYDINCYSLNTLIIGSGAASLNAAVNLHSLGIKDLMIMTEKLGGGTSANAGSDKQTYYKLSLAGSSPDSPEMMAKDLFEGHCMHGDIALCEAQGSTESFMNLVRLGVAFPQNRFGAWVGYKTDNDPHARATSAGPFTSAGMFRVLAGEIRKRRIKVLDRHRVIALLYADEAGERKITGAIALDLRQKDSGKAFVMINCVNTILGTGGPGDMYEASVYPASQSGSIGIAFEAGATGQNLTESQFGITSVRFRWNLSGSFQQVMPSYISTDKKGNDRREFLNDFFPDLATLTRAIFLKGYHWPFNAGEVKDFGPSLIDLLVYREKVIKGRRVWLDYSSNPSGPSGEKFEHARLDTLIREYLERSGAACKTPFERLFSMNQPAVNVYRAKNIDLNKDLLEIAVSAQHNNGGLKGNIWWESDLKHLFPVGEVNGSHGVSRPGGSALNSGQVGSRRAALFIAKKYRDSPPRIEDFMSVAKGQVEQRLAMADKWIAGKKGQKAREFLAVIRRRMTESGGIIRSYEQVSDAVTEARKMLITADEMISADSVKEIAEGFRLVEHCLAHYIYLSSIKNYIGNGGRSRGSFIVSDPHGVTPVEGLENSFRYTLCDFDREIENRIMEVVYRNMEAVHSLAPVRPIPDQELWFEKVWKKNLEDNLTEC